MMLKTRLASLLDNKIGSIETTKHPGSLREVYSTQEVIGSEIAGEKWMAGQRK